MGLARPGAGSLVLAPGRRQVDAVATRLRAAGLPVAVLPDEWAAARRGGCVVAGTRAAFAPIADLGAAVVIDAHDQAYHQEQAPTWSAWQVAVEGPGAQERRASSSRHVPPWKSSGPADW